MADVENLRQPRWNRQGSLADWLADNCRCDVCTVSNPDRTGPRVMSGMVAHPDESLIGLIARTSAQNWLPRVRSLLAAASTVWHAHFNLAAREDFAFDQLAFAARLPPHEVEARRYRRTEIMSDMPGLDFHGATIPVYDLDLKPRRVAASWLRTGYHSAFAHHSLVTHCPASGEVLFDECPRCGTGLNWTKSAFSHCATCGLDIAEHHGACVPRRTLHATRPMLDIIHPHPARHAPAMAKLNPQLAELNRGLVFELGWRMGSVLTGQGVGGRDEASHLPVETRLRVLASGSRILRSWPDGLNEALRGRSSGPSVGPSATLAGQIRAILTSGNCWPPLREILHGTVPELTSSAAGALKSVLQEGVNSGELQQTLRISQRVLDRLRVTPHLTAVRSSGEVKSHEIFEAAGLHGLRDLLDDRISVGSIAERLDISRHGVEQLACLGFIEIYDTGPLRDGFLARQARRSDFRDLVERISKVAAARAAGDEALEGPTIPLHLALKVIGGREKPWGPVIAALLAGTLPFKLNLSHGDRLMSRVSIHTADVGRLLEMHFDVGASAKQGVEFERSINGRDTEELLNIFPKMTRTAREDGSLPAPKDGLHDRKAILALAAKHITASEILARWNGRGRKMPKPFVGRSRLLKLDTLGWDRIAAETAMAAVDTAVSAQGRRDVRS